MELRRVLQILMRRWWLVVGLPLVVSVGTILLSSSQPYVGTFRASVLIPTDTQETGNAERPELMVMDDLPQIIGSESFAAAVRAQLRADDADVDLPVDEIQRSFSAERRSRIATVNVTREDRGEALALAAAAEAVLPTMVRNYMVADGEPPASVQTIDPPTVARRNADSQMVILVVQTLVALGVGAGLAALAAALDERLYAEEEVVAALGLPVLADLRATKRGHGGRSWPWANRWS
jgi:capsular polysaccharide biosynthesis protein